MLVHVFLYLAYAVLNTAAMAAARTVLPRLTAGRRGAALGALALGGSIYVVVLGVMLLLLRDGDASTVLPIAIGCTMLSTNIAGARFYGERITGRKLIGAGLIAAGIALNFIGGAPR